MAVVRISDQMKKIVMAAARNTFEKRHDAARASLELPMTAEDVYSCIFGEWVDKMEALPKEFFNYSSEFVVERIHGIGYSHTFKLVAEMPLPRNIPAMPHVRTSRSYGANTLELLDDGSGTWTALFQAFEAWRKRVVDIENERATFVSGIKHVLDSHTTLAAALRTWPPLWDLIPETYRNKHREVVPKKDKQQEMALESGVDMDRLTAIAAINKMI
jgi:hypothetical protein